MSDERKDQRGGRPGPRKTRHGPAGAPMPASKAPTFAAQPMRIQRAIARAGVLSRRKAEELIAAGRVTVNGTTAKVGQTVDPERDAIAVDGKPVPRPTAVRWIVMHKPAAVLTTKSDPGGRTTVFDLVPNIPGLTYVGRLDYLTEGLILLTTDGDAAHALAHPSRQVERTYVVTVRGDALEAAHRARQGVMLDDGPVRPRSVSVEKLGRSRWDMTVTITEGRNHEVRRFCEALGLEVERLVRTRYGPVELGTLAPGEIRDLTPSEWAEINALVAAPHAR
jgi:23S rRNA pseudouridine2605 synthase